MKEHEHQWDKQPETSLCQRGTCYCGAVRFFPTSGATAAVKQAEILNQKMGREGHSDNFARDVIAEKREEGTKMQRNESPPPMPNPAAIKRTYRKTEKLFKQLDKVKDKVIADYHSMTVREFLKKWHLSSNTWNKLKERWGVKSKGRVNRYARRDVNPAKTAIEEPVEEVAQTGDKPQLSVDYEITFDDSKFQEIIKNIETRWKELERLLPPGFPAFRWWWRKDVQVEWLKTYAKLMLGREK